MLFIAGIKWHFHNSFEITHMLMETPQNYIISTVIIKYMYMYVRHKK